MFGIPDIIWYLIGLVGFGGAILVLIGFLMGWPFIINFFLYTKVGRGIALVVGVIITILTFGAVQRKKGQAEADARHEQIDQDFQREREKQNAIIDDLPDDDLDGRLRDGSQSKPGSVNKVDK